jgi:hypothetical protein
MSQNNLQSVFLLWHTNPETEDVKLIGVYASNADAIEAMERVKDKPGFAISPSGFEISEYSIGQDSWTEGFGFAESE